MKKKSNTKIEVIKFTLLTVLLTIVFLASLFNTEVYASNNNKTTEAYLINANNASKEFTFVDSINSPQSVTDSSIQCLLVPSQVPCATYGYGTENTNKETQTTPLPTLTTDLIQQVDIVTESAIDTDSVLLAENYKDKESQPTVSLVTPSPSPTPEPESTTYSAPTHSGFKSWLPHRRESGGNMFASWSPQYKLQEKSITSDNGLRKYKGRYMIALGSYYTEEVGTYIDLIMEDGTVIKCVLGDQKADKDTDSMNQLHNDGSLVEFLVDRNNIPSRVKKSGDVSSLSDKFNQKVSYIKVYEKIAKI